MKDLPIDLEDIILNHIDNKHQHIPNNWLKITNYKRREEHFREKSPIVKKSNQNKRIEQIESERSQNLDLYQLLKTNLHIRPKFVDSEHSALYISSKQSPNPKITFNLRFLTLESFIDFDCKNHQTLVKIGDNRYLLINVFPTCVFDVPQCESIEELERIVSKMVTQHSKTRKSIRTFTLVPKFLYFVIYSAHKPSQFAKRYPSWGDNCSRVPGERYHNPHPLIRKFYPDYTTRIDYVSLLDITVVHDKVLDKWVKFEFYPKMFDNIISFSIGNKGENTLLCCEDLKVPNF
jgi:hypothetical protein